MNISNFMQKMPGSQCSMHKTHSYHDVGHLPLSVSKDYIPDS